MDVQQKINRLWDGAAKEYDKTPGHGVNDTRERAAWERALRPLLPPPPSDVLDVGTGTGVMALLIAGLGHRVRGVDLSEKMLAAARSNAARTGADVSFERGDAHDPQGRPASLDVVISRHLLWTLTDPRRALGNWRALLRRGGRLIIIDGIWWLGKTANNSRLGDIQDSLPLTHGMTLDDISALVRDAGFGNVTISDLAEVERVERELHGDSEEPPRYVITGRK